MIKGLKFVVTKRNKMESIRNKTVADFVTENIHTSNIFKKYGIDFCFNGKVSIENVCSKNDLDYHELESELEKIHFKTNYLNDFNKWALDFLMIFIVHIHHRYIRKNIPLLKKYGEKAVKIHGHNYSELTEINNHIKELSNELKVYMFKEETFVFPYIKKLFKASKKHTSFRSKNSNFINNSLKIMEEYHDKIGNVFNRISEVSNNYRIPENASTAYRKLYLNLQEFEDDFQQHVHLENNILFPKTLKLDFKTLNN